MGTTGRKTSRTGGIKPPLDIEHRQNQLVAKAMNLAEKQLDNGTASSQVITQFLKYGTINAQLEREKLIYENELLRAKREQIDSQKKSEEAYKEVINALKIYGGHGSDDDYDEYDDYDDY